MSGTKNGGLKARDTNLKRQGEDFYKVIGAKGGKLGHTGGFYVNRELASKVGKLGGTVSRRSDRGGGKLNPEVIQKIKEEFYESNDIQSA